jgi:hypothetical protein
VNFAPIDWAIVVGYLAVPLVIGVLGKRYIGNVAHFLVAGRELGLYIGIATLAATEIGTITYMYNGEPATSRSCLFCRRLRLHHFNCDDQGRKRFAQEMIYDLSQQQKEDGG